MMFLNLGCSATRPRTPNWINVDYTPDNPDLKAVMERESNYVDHNLLERLPFDDNFFDGALCSHLLEHFDVQDCLKIVRECNRVLKPGGILRVSVPDPKMFLEKTLAGNELWDGEVPPAGMTFMEYALFFSEHKQLLGVDAVRCLLFMANMESKQQSYGKTDCDEFNTLASLDNRPSFSVFIEGRKRGGDES